MTLYVIGFVAIAAGIVVALAALLDPPFLGLPEGPSPVERGLTVLKARRAARLAAVYVGRHRGVTA